MKIMMTWCLYSENRLERDRERAKARARERENTQTQYDGDNNAENDLEGMKKKTQELTEKADIA